VDYNPGVARNELCQLICNLELPLGIDSNVVFEHYIRHVHATRAPDDMSRREMVYCQIMEWWVSRHRGICLVSLTNIKSLISRL
jgi:hypothetical protein